MATVDSTLATLALVREKFSAALMAPNTERGYRYDFQAFARWCETVTRAALPANRETLSLYRLKVLNGSR